MSATSSKDGAAMPAATTNLVVRFGARAYEPLTSRWTARVRYWFAARRLRASAS